MERLVYPGGSTPLQPDQMAALGAWIDAVPQTSRDACAFVKARFKACAKLAPFKGAFDTFFDTLPTFAAEIKLLITERFRFIGVTNSRVPAA